MNVTSFPATSARSSLPDRLRVGALLLALTLGSRATPAWAYGLGASVGPAGGLSLTPRASIVGRTSVVAQLGRDYGLLLGLEQEAGGIFEVLPHDRWSTSLLGGYGWQPLPHRPNVGFEVVGRLSIGRFPLGTRSVFGYGFGPRVSLPIRPWGARQPLWDAETVLGPEIFLVPSLEGMLHARHGSLSEGPTLELSAGLALRGYLWSSLVP